MTREEAIEILEYPVRKWSMDWSDRDDGLSYTDALDMAISALREQPRWISVEEALPDGWWIDPETGYGEPEEYLVFVKGAVAPTVANYLNGKFVSLLQDATGFADVVTHWMPLPEPPKEEV